MKKCLVCGGELWTIGQISPIYWCVVCGTLHGHHPNTGLLEIRRRPNIIKALQKIDPLRRTKP